MSRRPTRAYRLYVGHSLEELTVLMVEVQSRGLVCRNECALILSPEDSKLSHELARAIQWKLDERISDG